MNNTDVLLFLSIFSILIFSCIIIITLKYKAKNGIIRRSSIIPKIIWCYWHTTSLPLSIQKCIQTWKVNNPGTKIIILNQNNYKDFVSIDIDPSKIDSYTRFSDYLRFQLLAQYGGVWMDASIICNKSLDWVFEKEAEFVGFYMPNFTKTKDSPVIENWFMAASKNSYFMNVWNKEIQSIKTFDKISDYLEYLRKEKIDFDKIPYPEYLMCHVAVQKIFQTHNYKFNLHLENAIGENGPFRYLDENNWESKKALIGICQNQKLRTPLIKLRGDERKILDEKFDDFECIYKGEFNSY